MSIQPELIKQSQLVGKLVLDRQSMEEKGKVERVWLDPRTHRIVGITCKSGFVGMKKLSFAWQQIYSLGNNVLVNNIADGDEWQKPDVSEQILDWELITDDGNKAGKIEDYLIEPNTGEVVSYLFLAIDRGNILTRRFLLSPEGIDNIGNKRVLARKIAVENSAPYTEGLNRLLTEARDFIIEDKDTTLQHVEAVKSRFTGLVEQFKNETPTKLEQVKGQVTEKVQGLAGQAQGLAGQATEKVQGLKDQATEKVQGLAGQATEKVQGFKEQATEKAQGLAGQATEKVQGFKEQATEKAQTLKDQATEKVQGFKDQATEKAQVLKEQATGKVQELAGLAEQAKEKAQSLADEAQPKINQAIDQAKEKAQSLAEGAQPIINQAKEKVQAIAEETKKQLEKKTELVAPGDENITQTVETTAERVVDSPVIGAIAETTEASASPAEAPKSNT